MLGIEPKPNFEELIKVGAVIVDVRSKEEYAGGHVKGSFNIPLNKLDDTLKKFKNMDQVIITCCASGMRSASAKSILKAKGYNQVHNGGSWVALRRFEK